MARKDLMKGLMDAGEPRAPETPRPRYAKGAIGAVSQSIAELKSRAVVEIDPALIDAGGLVDRLGQEDGDHAALIASIADYGQQVPILVRPHPETEGRFQIVYGRRRLLALRDLGLPAKALVRDLDDGALVMAQGQENTARRDLSFIEKCNFARQMREAGYDRKAMCDALAIDKTLISRMLSVVDRVGLSLVEAIGAAPGIGRERWLALADRLDASGSRPDDLADRLRDDPPGDSVARFDAAMAALVPDAPRPSPRRRQAARVITGDGGRPIARVARKDKATTLTLPSGDGFEAWLVDNLQEFHRQWATGAAGKKGPKPDHEQQQQEARKDRRK